jgi:hypothetical protein
MRRADAAHRYIAQERPPLEEERYALLLAVVCPSDDRLIDMHMNTPTTSEEENHGQ